MGEKRLSSILRYVCPLFGVSLFGTHQSLFVLLSISNIAGAKIHQSVSCTRFIEQGGRTYSVEEGTDIPEGMVPLHEHAQEGLRKCKAIEETRTELETQGSGGSYFPIFAGKRRKRRSHVSLLPSSSSSAATVSTSHNPPQSNSNNQGRSKDARSPPLASQSSLSDLCTTSPSTVQFPDHVTVSSA